MSASVRKSPTVGLVGNKKGAGGIGGYVGDGVALVSIFSIFYDK